jgi:hypothetical protein
VSYIRTESSVATAYIIRYGNEKAIVGPCEFAFVSTSNNFDFKDVVGPAGSVVDDIGGGGSIIECAGDLGITGSGSSAIVSSADEVSIVMFFVWGVVFRVV